MEAQTKSNRPRSEAQERFSWRLQHKPRPEQCVGDKPQLEGKQCILQSEAIWRKMVWVSARTTLQSGVPKTVLKLNKMTPSNFASDSLEGLTELRKAVILTVYYNEGMQIMNSKGKQIEG